MDREGASGREWWRDADRKPKNVMDDDAVSEFSPAATQMRMPPPQMPGAAATAANAPSSAAAAAAPAATATLSAARAPASQPTGVLLALQRYSPPMACAAFPVEATEPHRLIARLISMAPADRAALAILDGAPPPSSAPSEEAAGGTRTSGSGHLAAAAERGARPPQGEGERRDDDDDEAYEEDGGDSPISVARRAKRAAELAAAEEALPPQTQADEGAPPAAARLSVVEIKGESLSGDPREIQGESLSCGDGSGRACLRRRRPTRQQRRLRGGVAPPLTQLEPSLGTGASAAARAAAAAVAHGTVASSSAGATTARMAQRWCARTAWALTSTTATGGAAGSQRAVHVPAAAHAAGVDEPPPPLTQLPLTQAPLTCLSQSDNVRAVRIAQHKRPRTQQGEQGGGEGFGVAVGGGRWPAAAGGRRMPAAVAVRGHWRARCGGRCGDVHVVLSRPLKVTRPGESPPDLLGLASLDAVGLWV